MTNKKTLDKSQKIGEVLDICPVCHSEPTRTPHNVCAACLQKYRREIVHTREWAEQRFSGYDKTPDGSPIPPDMMAQNIQRHMHSEEEAWARITDGGLCASRVAVDAIDEDGELPKQTNHPRRIAFMLDLIALLPDSCFVPASREQVSEALLVAKDYWDGQATDAQRKQAHDKLRDMLGKTNPSNWDLHSLPLWTLETECFFDWMWYQWFDCVWSCIPDEMVINVDCVFTELLQKHFPDEIRNWVDNE